MSHARVAAGALRRTAVVLALVAGLAPQVPAAAAPAPAVARATLRVSGSGGGYGEVRLTRPLPRFDLRRLVVSSSGDQGHVAVLLVRQDGPAEAGMQFLIAERFPSNAGEPWRVGGDSGGSREHLLPAATYRVYLLSAKPVTVTLRLPGQPAGTTGVTPRVRVRHRLGELDADRLNGGYRPAGHGYETFTLRKPGFAVASAVLDYASMWDYHIAGCFYRGEPPPGEDAGQVCAAGTSVGVGGGYVVPSTTPNRVADGVMTYPIQPRTVTYGVHYRFVGQLTNVRQFLLWLELDA